MLSAVIVNKQHVLTGEMEPETIKVFVQAANDLGYDVLVPLEFLREQQEAWFAWGALGGGMGTPTLPI